MNKIQLIGQNLEELQLFCINNKYPKFHGDQLYHWIKGVENANCWDRL